MANSKQQIVTIILVIAVGTSIGLLYDEELMDCAVEICKRSLSSSNRIFISLETHSSNLSRYGQTEEDQVPHALFPNKRKKRSSSVVRSCSVKKSPDSLVKAYINNTGLLLLPGSDFPVIWDLRTPTRKGYFNDIQNYLIKKLHSTGAWKIVVSAFKKFDLYEFREFKGYRPIIILSYLEESFKVITEQLLGQYDAIRYVAMTTSKIVVVVIGKLARSTIAHLILAHLAFFDAYNAVVILREMYTKHVKIYSWTPFRGPSGNCNKLESVLLLDTWLNGRLLRNISFSDQIFPERFDGCTLEAVGVHNPPLVIADDSDTVIVGGLEIQLLQMISSALGLKLKAWLGRVFRVDVDIWIGVGHFIVSKLPVAMEQYHTLEFRWFVPVAKSNPRWAVVLRVFSLNVWGFLLISLLFTAGVLLITYKILLYNTERNSPKNTKLLETYESSQYNNFVECTLNLWAIILNVTVDQKPRTASLRILFIAWTVFSVSVVTVFQAYMTSYYTDTGKQHQINSYEELVATNFTLAFDSTKMSDRNSILGKAPAYYFPRTLDMLNYAYQVPKTAVNSDKDLFAYNFQKLCDLNETVKFHKFRETVEMPISLLNGRASPYLGQINKLTRRLVEAGVPNQIMKTLTDPTGRNQDVKVKVNLSDEYVPLTMRHLFFIFTVLGLGLGSSSAVLLCEIMLGKCIFREKKIIHQHNEFPNNGKSYNRYKEISRPIHPQINYTNHKYNNYWFT